VLTLTTQTRGQLRRKLYHVLQLYIVYIHSFPLPPAVSFNPHEQSIVMSNSIPTSNKEVKSSSPPTIPSPPPHHLNHNLPNPDIQENGLHALVNIQTAKDIWTFLLVFRVFNSFLVKTFFQPDEYFQALEPAWEMAFGEGSGAWITWVCDLFNSSCFFFLCVLWAREVWTVYKIRRGERNIDNMVVILPVKGGGGINWEKFPSCYFLIPHFQIFGLHGSGPPGRASGASYTNLSSSHLVSLHAS